MVDPIVPFGFPALRERCREAIRFDRDLDRTLDRMWKILRARRDGAALAAPQIGRNLRAFVMDYHDTRLEAVHPVIEDRQGRVVGPEGCLSLPGYSGQVPRAERIVLRWQDREGGSHREEFAGEVARCIQHETDHLDGILYIDRMEEDFLLAPDGVTRTPLRDVPGWRETEPPRG